MISASVFAGEVKCQMVRNMCLLAETKQLERCRQSLRSIDFSFQMLCRCYLVPLLQLSQNAVI